jgi:A/G-specific adenine glycosylase
VLARIFGIEVDIASHAGKKIFSKLAGELISAEHPDTYNQAIMEFGAMLCTPAKPQCMFCPFNQDCIANITGRQEVLPVKGKKLKTKERFFHYLIFTCEEEVAMRERTGKDIWSGLYDFYLLEKDGFVETHELLQSLPIADIQDQLIVEKKSDVFVHVLTHQRVQAKFWHLSVPAELKQTLAAQLGLTFYEKNQTEDLPKPVLINKYLNEHLF